MLKIICFLLSTGKQHNNNNHSNANNGNIQNPLPLTSKHERRRTVSFRKNIDSLEYLRRSTTPDVKEVFNFEKFEFQFFWMKKKM